MQRFWLELTIIFYASATGFVAAGIASSFYELVAAEKVRFRLFSDSISGWLLSIVFLGVTGPYIVCRQAVRMRSADSNALGWLIGGLLICAVWSVCSGLVVLGIALEMRDRLM